MRKSMFMFLATAVILINPCFAAGDKPAGVAEKKTPEAAAENEPIIFPKEGQSKEQLAQDKTYCKGWAQEETGIDPETVQLKIENIEEETVTEKQTTMGGLLEGIVKGAATGAAVGAIEQNIDNEVGSDAVKGAVLGGIMKHEKQVDKKEEIAYRKDTLEKEDLEEAYGRYMRAFTVCLEAKGYAVK